ncbi:hypothetical protein DNTS_005798 [Danionella cerebrum]|uniref:Tyrosine-protein kinase n=1 Tax=Danionella cerebrum TaxID=2873325 RepID=A0A553PIY9_9TELE|nr:hypothetical protein DNTS_005798 [Danionella translucida]
MLMSQENMNGAFLIRNCESQTGELSLSVKHLVKVKHYKIRRLDNVGYCLSQFRNFSTLRELVEHYSTYNDGLCVRLAEPCKKSVAPETRGLSYNTVDHWEIKRSSVELLNKLGAGQFGEVFEGRWNGTTAVAVQNGYRMPSSPNCPERLYKIMLECWKEVAVDRPTFETLHWKLEEFYDADVSSYDDANRY